VFAFQRKCQTMPRPVRTFRRNGIFAKYSTSRASSVLHVRTRIPVIGHNPKRSFRSCVRPEPPTKVVRTIIPIRVQGTVTKARTPSSTYRINIRRQIIFSFIRYPSEYGIFVVVRRYVPLYPGRRYFIDRRVFYSYIIYIYIYVGHEYASL